MKDVISEQTPGRAADASSFDSAAAVIRWVSAHSLAEHPLVRRIEQTSEGGLLWLLIHNTYRGTSLRFATWLASVTATVEDERARSLLARQLNEEMGDGDVERAHSRLMKGFLAAIEPLRPATLSPALTAPGEVLRSKLSELYLSANQYRALATLMAGEVCAHQLIASVGNLLRPHLDRLDRSQLTWLTHHNEVEGDHAGESLELANFVPHNSLARSEVVAGAIGLHSALWTSMDTLLLQWLEARRQVDAAGTP